MRCVDLQEKNFIVEADIRRAFLDGSSVWERTAGQSGRFESEYRGAQEKNGIKLLSAVDASRKICFNFKGCVVAGVVYAIIRRV